MMLKRYHLKIFLFLALVANFCSAEQKILINLGRGHHEEYFCEFILNLDQWWFKDISYLQLGWPFVQFW